MVQQKGCFFGNKILSLQQKSKTMEKRNFRLVLLEEASKFIEAQPQSVANKIYYNIYRIASGEKNAELFSKLTSNIWEFRTLYNGMAYRLFAFWDKDNETLVVATHGIVKKTQKTPSKEIAKAEEIRKDWFNGKR